MKETNRWMQWKPVDRGGSKPTKVPYQSNGSLASSTNPSTWSPYEAVTTADGGRLGFALGDGWAGVDLDNVIVDGELLPWAEQLVEQLDSYAEVSPSGNGVKIFLKTDLQLSGKNGSHPDGGSIEVYGAGRYFTVTGNKLPGAPAEVNQSDDALHHAHTLAGGCGTTGTAKADVAEWPDMPSVDDLTPYFEQVKQLSESIEGHRGHDALFHASCEVKRMGLNEEDSLEVLQHYNMARCQPTWSGYDLRRKLNEGCKAVLGERAAALQALTEASLESLDRSHNLTDMGNAERLASQFGGELRYVAEWKRWLYWDGRRWAKDVTGETMQRIKSVVRGIYGEAAEKEDDEARAKLAKHAKTSESKARIEAVEVLARSEKPFPSTPGSFDDDPMLLNTEDGTIDLATGTLRPHDPGDLLTMSTRTGYASGDAWSAPTWTRFLGEIFKDDTEMTAYVQRLFGYALIGEQTVHVFPILHGDGANGKSVFVGALQHALGDYATTAAPKLFVRKSHDGHPTGLADLYGRRLVVLNESEGGDSLDEAFVKGITGGDTIKARKMRQDFWEFEPSHTAVMVTNHRPGVRGQDEGIWRRLKLIPFNAFIPPEQRDAELPAKLKAEAPAILRWLVEGCLAFQRRELTDEPEAVQAATRAYRGTADPLYAWLDAHCERATEGRSKASELLQSFNDYLKARGDAAVSQNEFAKRMTAAGFEKKRGSDATRYVGLWLASPVVEEIDPLS
ncbi:hypothetical protein MalM25_28710 [Planctomycetes bacterium MalM25]|nr:hypothetical protein MalM25_28710 [Planctomycetes bacterium MalM25]